MDEFLNNTPEQEETNQQEFPIEQEQPISDSFEEQNIQYDDFEPDFEPAYTDPPFQMTEIRRMPLNTSNKGLRVFVIALCAIILLTCCTAGGYLLGQNSSGKSTQKGNSKVSLNLEAKPNSKELSKAEVYKKANPYVVGIQVYNDKSSSTASGVIFSKDGYIITNDHIYENIASPKFIVYTSDQKEYKATFVAGDTRSDLAVLKIDGVNDLTPAVFGDSEQLYIGENTVAIGRPISADTDSNLTYGTISLLNRRLSITSSYSLKYIQTDAPVNPGSSGGALLNMYGQVIGITSAKIAGEEYEGLSFAIPSVTVKRVAESLIKHGYVTDRAKLGISYYEVTAVTADINGYPRGLFVAEIDQSSDAYGKLQKGDIITTVNGEKITSDDVMLDVIDQSSPGDTLTLSGETDDGKSFSYEIALGEDKGSSSYGATQSDDDNTSSQNNHSFDFPFGE